MSEDGRALREPALVNHAPAGHGPSGFDPARGWDIPTCLRWLDDNRGSGQVPSGELTGVFLKLVADRVEWLASERDRLSSEVFVLAAQNARLRKLKKARDPDETDDAISDLLDNQAWIILSHVAARIGPPDLMEAWQDAWAAGEVQEGYFTPTRGVAAWIASHVTLRDTDRSGEAGQTAKQAGPKARAGAEGIAQDPSPLNQDSSNG